MSRRLNLPERLASPRSIPHWDGAINITTTQQQLPGLGGAVTSFFSPLLFSIIISLIWPGHFDRREYLKIDSIEDKSPSSSNATSTTAFNTGSTNVDEKRVAIESLDTATTTETANGG